MFVEHKASGEPSVQGLLDFVKGKPENEDYNWSNNDRCACAQYAESIGRLKEWTSRNQSSSPMWDHLNILARAPTESQGFGGQMHGTFGVLRSVLERKVREIA